LKKIEKEAPHLDTAGGSNFFFAEIISRGKNAGKLYYYYDE